MNKIKEHMKNMTTEGWIITAVIGALLIVIIISLLVTFVGHPGKNRFSFDKKDYKTVTSTSTSATDTFVDKAKDNIFVSDKPVTPYVYPVTKPVSTPSPYQYTAPVVQKEEVRIGLIIARNEYDVTNVISGTCGDVYLVTAYMPSPMLLTSSLKALFGDKVYADFLPGNIIPSRHPNLTFDYATISNGVANIYLGGKFHSGDESTCDRSLALAQIEETAKSYSTVSKVNIYLGTVKVN